MGTTRIAFAVAATMALSWHASPAEASRCSHGRLYRPSLGTCVSRASFARDVAPPARTLRGRWHRAARHERVRVVKVFVERRVVVPAAPQAATPAATDAPLMSSLPYAMAGRQSLNPLPRWHAKGLGDAATSTW